MPDDEGLREELAAALSERLRPRSGMSVRAVMRLAEHILPVVERYAARRTAEALRGRTDGVRRWANICNPGPFRDGLVSAADAIAADGTEARHG